MTTQRYDSVTARVKFDEIIEALRKGSDVIFEQEGNPVAVAIPFEDFLAIEEELDDARAGRRAQALFEAWKRDPSLARPYEEVRAEWLAEGLLDEQDMSEEELRVLGAWKITEQDESNREARKT